MGTTDNKTNVYGVRDGKTGSVYTVAGSDPAAGAEVTYTVGSGQALLLKGIRFALVTDATVANRVVALQIKDDAGVVVFETSAAINQAASLTYTYTFAAGLGYRDTAISTGLTLGVGIPDDLLLPAGWTIVTSTTLIKAGDNYGAPVIFGVLYQ